MPRTGTEQPARRRGQLGREAAAEADPETDRTTRIVAADGHPVVLAGVCRLCDHSSWLRLEAVARTGAEAVAAVREHLPDLVVMETRFPDLAAIDLIKQLRVVSPDLRIVLFTADATRAAHTAAADDSVAAVVHKRSDLADLEGVLRRLVNGERLMPVRDSATSRRTGRGPGGLTSREHEILQKVAAGMTNVEIAQELGLTHNTIKTYFQRTLEKLGARNRVEALLRADEKGLL